MLELNERFCTDEELSNTPIILGRTATNAAAYAHGLRLAAYEYPEAFGSGYKSFSISETKAMFLSYGYLTFGVGQDQKLQAGISIYRTPPSGAWGTSYDTPRAPSIEFLFKHKALNNLTVGRTLAATAFGYLLECGYDEVSLCVTARNTIMRKLYTRLGFREVAYSTAQADKVIGMKLDGRSALANAHNKLRNQL